MDGPGESGSAERLVSFFCALGQSAGLYGREPSFAREVAYGIGRSRLAYGSMGSAMRDRLGSAFLRMLYAWEPALSRGSKGCDCVEMLSAALRLLSDAGFSGEACVGVVRGKPLCFYEAADRIVRRMPEQWAADFERLRVGSAIARGKAAQEPVAPRRKGI